MAGHRVADQLAGIDVSAAELVEGYLAEIETRLPRPRRARTAAIDELRDGLCDALDAYRCRGLDDLRAARAAVDESGPAGVVADAYRSVLADRHARLTGLALIATGPLLGLLWLAALAPGRPPTALLVGIPFFGGVVAVGALAGLVTVAATGSTGRWLPDIARLPQRAVSIACVAAVTADITLLTVAVTRVVTAPAALPWAVALAAALASASRILYSQYAFRAHLRSTASTD